MKTAIKITVPLAFAVAAGVGTYATIARLSDNTIAMLLGGLGVLVTVLVVGLLFTAKDLAQAYILRRMVPENDNSDLHQMVILGRLLQSGSGSSTVNLLPPSQSQMVDSPYRDVTTEEIEIQ